MDQFLSSLAFKGTIAEAITEAKLQKKLFVVYIAGDKPESKLLQSTWINPTVSEALAKYCIFLQISEGSSEASYFSAIYPQNNTPCITVIGYNGTRLWQKEGFVSADVLSTSLEKAWLSLHLQETTAAFLTATLASRISGSSSSEQQTTGAISEHQTTGPYGSLPLTNDLSLSLDAELPNNSEARIKRHSHDDACEEPDCKMDGEIIHASHANILTNNQTDEPKPTTETESLYLNPEGIGRGEPEVVCPVTEKNLDFGGLCSGSGTEISQDIFNETIAAPQMKRPETAEVEKVDALDSPAIKTNNVCFNIRLPDGSLQANFSAMNTLRVVHEYINDNQTSRLGSFDLAIPYPRHVFSDQDLDSTLSALGLLNRQTLTVVPQEQTNLKYREMSSVHSSTDPSSSSESNEGYLASVKRILSYVNPFSYLSGGADSRSPGEELPSDSWQYNPNSSLETNARGSSASPAVYSSDKNTSESSKNIDSRSRQKTYGFGANIHTLKRDEDDNDKNIYWNGNSTQFGGSDDRK